MIEIAVSKIRNLSKPQLRILLAGGSPVTIVSGRGKEREPMAVLVRYDTYISWQSQLEEALKAAGEI